MRSEALVSPEHSSTSQQGPRRRVGFYVFVAVLLVVSVVILSFVSIGLFTPMAEVEITASTLRSSGELSGNYRRVSVDLSLYNSGRGRGTTVWAEITNQATNVSFSKTRYVQIEYGQSKTLTIEFTLDSLIYYGNFTHRVWLTYPTSQD